MNDCRRVAERLTPFLDGALPPAERDELQQHLDACPPCRVTAEQESGGRTLLRERADHLRAAALPPGLRTRCEAIARSKAAARPSWTSRLIPASVVAALIVLAVFAAFIFATQRSNTLLAAQLSTDHDRCFRETPLAAGGLDAAAEETRLAESYGWDVHIPPSSPDGRVKLVGARRCLYSHGGVPHLLYDAGGQELSLYVFEGVNREPGEVVTQGHRARIWTRGTTTFVLVTPDSAGEMAEAVAYVREHAR